MAVDPEDPVIVEVKTIRDKAAKLYKDLASDNNPDNGNLSKLNSIVHTANDLLVELKPK